MNDWSARWQAATRFCALGGHFLQEAIVPPKATNARQIPRSAAAITPEWLTAVLCAQTPGARVTDFHATGGSSGTATRCGLQLELNDAARAAGIPSHLFSKSTPRFNQRVMMGFSGIIHGEVGFYPQLRPLLDIEAPLGYYAGLDNASWRSMVLMEDVVATRSAQFFSNTALASCAQMADLLANMARWHGRLWESPLLQAQSAWLRTPAAFLATIAPLGFHFLARLGLRRARHVIPSAVLGHTDELWRALAASLDINRQGPRTLLHGDPHIGQTYVTGTELTGNGNMGYADWQIVMQGGWAFDVAYAIASSLAVADRRAWETELLRGYLDRLHACGGPAIPFDTAWLAYRQQMIYPYFCWLMTIAGPIVPLLPNMQPDALSLAIIERTATSIDDLDSLKACR